MSRPRFIGLLLALLTLAVYLPVARHGFILYDDGDYVTDNPVVRNGLTLSGIKWAFTTFHSANWHPLTWLSHMADCEWFGLNAAGPHCINALLHAANTVLVFALWWQLTRRKPETGAPEDDDGAVWPAAFIAALFAVHPLHVESVAWISERKDVLSTFFGLLALLCYARYAKSRVQSPEPTVQSPQSQRAFYTLALFFFAAGLISKPMLVTWPFVMLLLDFWPFQRFNVSTFQRLLAEKLPFFALTAASCVVTYVAQSQGAVRSLAAVPLVYRLENTSVVLATYLFKIVWPARLAVIYPMPQTIPAALFIGCSALLLTITVGVCLAKKRYPFLPVGWFWFLGTLVPVIGLVKVGDAAMADRYMYIPSIGIFMIVAMGIKRISECMSLPKNLLPALAAVVLAALTVVTERQLQFWRDDETLFKHAMDVTKDNAEAMINYGAALEYLGKPMEAMQQYRQAEKIAPDSYLTHADIGNLLDFMGKPAEALAEYQRALQLYPDARTLHDRLGMALAALGRYGEATNQFYEGMQLDPDSASPHFYLGIALAQQNNLREATNEFAQALRLAPGDPSVLVEWAKALLRHGLDVDAMNQLNAALQMDPDNFQTLTFAARVLASDKHSEVRNGAQALELAQRAEALTGGEQPLVQDALGMALAENGQFDAAQKAVTDAIRLANDAGMKHEIITAMQERLALYAKHQPWREKADFAR
jgi:protein O-mannosyl-transferase